MGRRSNKLKVMQPIRGPAGTDPFHSLKNPNRPDLNKGALEGGGREEGLYVPLALKME